MSLTAAVSGSIVLFLAVSAVQCQDIWKVTYFSNKVCALKGSTVEIRCTYEYPAKINGKKNELSQTFWFSGTEGLNKVIENSSNYSGRVKSTCNGNKCNLKISDLRETDSDYYFFRIITNRGRFFGQPGVRLNITGLEVVVQKKQSVFVFKCLSNCPDDFSFIWFKNGQEIEDEKSKSYYYSGQLLTDRYSCAVQGYEKFPSPPVYTPGLPSVSVSPSGEVVERSSINLTCSSDANPAASYTWYKKDENLDLQPQREGPQLVFSSIQTSDSGEYYCEAENSLGKTQSEPVSVDVKSVSEGTTLQVVGGIIAVVLLVILSLSVFLWMRQKKASSESPQAEERPNNPEQFDQRQPEDQNNLQYSTIHFSKNQADLYSNITSVRPIRHTEQQDVSEYAVVKSAGNSSASRGQYAGEDPAVVYSTVNRTR